MNDDRLESDSLLSLKDSPHDRVYHNDESERNQQMITATAP
jgi:hypothetical protein